MTNGKSASSRFAAGRAKSIRLTLSGTKFTECETEPYPVLEAVNVRVEGPVMPAPTGENM